MAELHKGSKTGPTLAKRVNSGVGAAGASRNGTLSVSKRRQHADNFTVESVGLCCLNLTDVDIGACTRE